MFIKTKNIFRLENSDDKSKPADPQILPEKKETVSPIQSIQEAPRPVVEPTVQYVQPVKSIQEVPRPVVEPTVPNVHVQPVQSIQVAQKPVVEPTVPNVKSVQNIPEVKTVPKHLLQVGEIYFFAHINL